MCSLNSVITKFGVFHKTLPVLNRFSNKVSFSPFSTEIENSQAADSPSTSEWNPTFNPGDDEGEQFRHLLRYSNFINVRRYFW